MVHPDIDPTERGSPNAHQERSSQQILFPSQELREDLGRLGLPPDKTPTDLVNMSPQDIARITLEEYGGVLIVNISAASKEEQTRILAADGIQISIGDEERRANVIAIGDTSEEGWFDSPETKLLRRIVEEALGPSDEADT